MKHPNRIASTLQLTEEEKEILQPSVCFPVWDRKPISADELLLLRANILITDTIPCSELLSEWCESGSGVKLVFVLQHDLRIEALNKLQVVQPNLVLSFFDRHIVSLQKAITNAETSFLYEQSTISTANLIRMIGSKQGKRVAVVGSGIVGLMTAFELTQLGYQVDVFDRTPDPRDGADWSAYGCTHGGENARMFSLTECDNYHDRSVLEGKEIHGHIDRPLVNYGWSLGKAGQYSSADELWKSEFRKVPIVLANHYNEDIVNLSHESLGIWRKMMHSHPHLFENITMTEGLLRICSTAKHHDDQVRRQKHFQAFGRELDRSSLIADYPALEVGCRSGEIYAGIEVEGFTLNIHHFVKNLINEMENSGAKFHWNTEVKSINRRNSVVWGLELEGDLRQWDHYFVSPGSYGRSLLDDTLTRNKIHGVLGAWITLENSSPRLQKSIKFSREGHIASCGNIIITDGINGASRLIIGSGFGYVGNNPENVSKEQLEKLYDSMQDYASKLFPDAYQASMDDGSLVASKKFCIRPWTPSCLGSFEVQEARDGCMIIASGHNTGGFAQSVSVAKAASAAIRGEHHPMHPIYHPNRFNNFWG